VGELGDRVQPHIRTHGVVSEGKEAHLKTGMQNEAGGNREYKISAPKRAARFIGNTQNKRKNIH